jgi:ParB family chromosome partitioning protein
MQIAIEEVKVKHRVRKDLGDLSGLKESMNRYGLMNPITVTPEYELIAGGRRLEAARELGWVNISALVLSPADAASRLEMELEENEQRAPFTGAELLSGYKKLEKLRRGHWWQRLWHWLKGLFLR